MLQFFQKIFFLICLFLMAKVSLGQKTDMYEGESKVDEKAHSSFGVGSGIFSFYGDLEKPTKLISLNNFKPGFSLLFEGRINHLFGIGVQGTMGTLAGSQRSIDPTLNINFKSDFYLGQADVYLHLDNGFLFKKKAIIAPYLAGGFGFMSFHSVEDRLNAQGNPYHYWTDGSIRTSPESINDETTPFDQWDYEYETDIKTDSADYLETSYIIPLSIGTKLHLSDFFEADFKATYYLSNTDYIDGINDNDAPDNFIYYSVSLNYKIGAKKAKKQSSYYKDEDFKALKKLDTDGDGILDDEDECPGTPGGLFVNSKGCPGDDDKDGVPDYMDREPNSPKNVEVDNFGRTMTDELIYQEYSKDTVAALRKDVIDDTYKLPDFSSIVNETHVSSLPKKYQSADLNNDGYISPDEITSVIDSFFEGQNFLTVERINELIDFFFEQ